MKKFETPKMNISMFAAENVATTSNATATNYDEALTALTSGPDAINEKNVVTFTF